MEAWVCWWMVISTVCVIVAMDAEAEPVRRRLGAGVRRDVPWAAWCPMRLATGSVAGGTVHVVVNGRDERHGVDLIGTQAATLSASQVIEHLEPDLVISAGTCGGFVARGGAIGDVYVAERELRYHDRRVPLPGFHESSLGAYACADLSGVASELGLKSGVVTTGDALDASAVCVERMEASGASVKEMEAAAIGWVCSLAGVPVTCVKSVTDLVDGGVATEEEFVANLTLAVERLADAVGRVVERVMGRELVELGAEGVRDA